jgi:TonB family protein
MVFEVNAQTDDKTTILQLNQQVVTFFQEGKLDEALKTAQKSLDLSLISYGAESQETALAYLNLGTLQREKRKYGEAAKNLQKSLDIYQKQPNFPTQKLIDLYQSLALTQFLDGKKTEAETNYLAALNASETKFGSDGKAGFAPTLNMANFYARNGSFEKADSFYLKSYRLALKHFGAESQEIEKIADSRVCLNKENEKREKLFHLEYDKLFGISHSKPEEIINGKALELARPPYPQEAKSQRLTGDVKIRVWITEGGSVYDARPACGDGILERASEGAARLSKFSPTFLNGKPVKVTGVLIYRFRAQ